MYYVENILFIACLKMKRNCWMNFWFVWNVQNSTFFPSAPFCRYLSILCVPFCFQLNIRQLPSYKFWFQNTSHLNLCDPGPACCYMFVFLQCPARTHAHAHTQAAAVCRVWRESSQWKPRNILSLHCLIWIDLWRGQTLNSFGVKPRGSCALSKPH